MTIPGTADGGVDAIREVNVEMDEITFIVICGEVGSNKKKCALEVPTAGWQEGNLEEERLHKIAMALSLYNPRHHMILDLRHFKFNRRPVSRANSSSAFQSSLLWNATVIRALCIRKRCCRLFLKNLINNQDQ